MFPGSLSGPLNPVYENLPLPPQNDAEFWTEWIKKNKDDTFCCDYGRLFFLPACPQTHPKAQQMNCEHPV